MFTRQTSGPHGSRRGQLPVFLLGCFAVVQCEAVVEIGGAWHQNHDTQSHAGEHARRALVRRASHESTRQNESMRIREVESAEVEVHSAGVHRHAPSDQILSITNVAAGGLQLPIGNALQFLMNALVFAEASGKKGVMVGGKMKDALSTLLDFGDGVIDLEDGHQNSSTVFASCGDLTGASFESCGVPLKLRRAVALRYLTPRLKPKGCVRDEASAPRLAIHLRSNEWCCDNPMYVQPPCAMYDGILKHGDSGGSFKNARVYGDLFARAAAFPDFRIYKTDPTNKDHPPWSNPCMKDLLQRSQKPEVGGANITASGGELTEDICDLISAHNVVLAASTFTSNLVLLNPRKPRLFVPLPGMDFPFELFRFFNRVEGIQNMGPKDSQTVERFMDELREVFPGSVGYQLHTNYLKKAKRAAAGEMLARDNFLAEYGWRQIPQ